MVNKQTRTYKSTEASNGVVEKIFGLLLKYSIYPTLSHSTTPPAGMDSYPKTRLRVSIPSIRGGGYILLLFLLRFIRLLSCCVPVLCRKEE